MRINYLKYVAYSALLILAVLLPFQFKPALVYNFTNAIVLSIAVIGMVFVTGFTKQISLGQNFFFAIGAYFSVYAIEQWNIPYLLTPFLAFIVTFTVGYVFGLPVLRLKGTYLALVTLGLGLVTPHLIRRFSDFTGGSMGTKIKPIKAPDFINLQPDQWIYFVALSFLLIVILVSIWLENSQVGRAMKAVGDQEVTAQLNGIDLRLTKSSAFAWSGGFAGVAGTLFVFMTSFVAPGSVDIFLGVYLLAALVIGGQRHISGAIIGAFFIVFIPLQTQDISSSLSGALFGLCVVVIMLVLPPGIIGGVIKIFEKLKNKIPNSENTKGNS